AQEVGGGQIPVNVQKLRGDEAQLVKLLDVLATKVALLNAEPTAGSRILQLQPPETPNDKDYSRLVKFGGATGLGMFGLVLFGIAFLEFRARKVNGVEEVTQDLGLSVVGTMPRLPVRARRNATANGSAR